MNSKIHLYPADFEDDDVGDLEGDRQTYYALMRNIASFAQINDPRENPIDMEKIDVPQVLTNLQFPYILTGSIFAMIIGLRTEKLEKLLEIADDYEQRVFQEIGGKTQIQDGKIKLTLKRKNNPDMYSKKNLLISQRISSHTRSIIRAAKYFLEDRMKEV